MTVSSLTGSTTGSPRKPNRLGYLLGCVLVLCTAIYLWVLPTFGASYASSADASGYFNSARMLQEGRVRESIRPIRGLDGPNWNTYIHQPLGYHVRDGESTMAPTYPIGLPLLLAIAAKLVGWNHAAIFINCLNALFAALLMLWIGMTFARLRFSWAVAATLILWACPLFLLYSLQPMSDALATTGTMLAIGAAAASRKKQSWALLAGIATGVGVLIRPTDALVIVPVAVLFGCSWRRWLWFGLGGLPLASILGIYNYATYHSVFSTGYGDVWPLFRTAYFGHNIAHFIHWIPQLLTPVVLLALGLPWAAQRPPRFAIAIGAWILGLICFYAFYYHSGETWWYLRFILPVFPFLLLASAVTAQRLCEVVRMPPFWCGSLLCFFLGWGLIHQALKNRDLNVTAIGGTNRAYYDAAMWLDQNIPPDSVLLAMQMSGCLHFYTKFPLLRYDMATPDQINHACRLVRSRQQPVYAALLPFETSKVEEARLGGNWEKLTVLDTVSIWRLVPAP